MLLLELGHVDRRQTRCAAVELVGQGEGGLGLAGPGRADHEEDALWPARIPQAGAGDADAFRQCADRGALPEDARPEPVLQGLGRGDLVAQQTPDRDARPTRHDRRDGLGIDGAEDQGIVARGLVQPGLGAGQLLHRVRAALGLDGVGLRRQRFLAFQAGTQGLGLGLCGGEVAAQLGHARRAAGDDGLQRKDVDLGRQIPDLGCQRHEALGRSLARHGDVGRGGVDQADRLVGQLPLRKVSRRQLDRHADGAVADGDAVMAGEGRGDGADHPDRTLDGGLVHLHHLEPAGQGGVLLDMLLVLRPSGRADGPQVATRQCRLEDVGRVALTGLPARADEHMRLVHEQHDGRLGGLHLIDDALQPPFELALHAGPGLELVEVERVERDAAELVGNAPGRNGQREGLHHSGLSDAGLAHEDRIVLTPAQQDVDHLTGFRIAADDGVDAAVARLLRQVGGVEREEILARSRHRRGGPAGGRGPCLRLRALLERGQVQAGQRWRDPAKGGAQLGVAAQGQEERRRSHGLPPEAQRRDDPGLAGGTDHALRQARRTGRAAARTLDGRTRLTERDGDIGAGGRQRSLDLGPGQQRAKPVLEIDDRVCMAHR